MLTGDKLETAETIGQSCNIIDPNNRKFYIKLAPAVNIQEEIYRISSEMMHIKR